MSCYDPTEHITHESHSDNETYGGRDEDDAFEKIDCLNSSVKEEDLASNINLVAVENNGDEPEEKPTREDFASVYSKPSSHTMSSINTTNVPSSPISTSTSSQRSQKLGFSIEQIMGFMSRNANLPKHGELEEEMVHKGEYTINNMEQYKYNAVAEKPVALAQDKANSKGNDATNNKNEQKGQELKTGSIKVDKPKYIKKDTNLWRPQPCRKYIANAAAIHAAAAVSALAAHSQSSTSLGATSTHHHANPIPHLSPTCIPRLEPISTMPQNLSLLMAPAPPPLQQPDINTMTLLRQYSLMNLNNPWKTASFLSSYSSLLGLHQQINFQQQKDLPGETHNIPVSIGFPYTINNNTSIHDGSSMTSSFESLSLIHI